MLIRCLDLTGLRGALRLLEGRWGHREAEAPALPAPSEPRGRAERVAGSERGTVRGQRTARVARERWGRRFGSGGL